MDVPPSNTLCIVFISISGIFFLISTIQICISPATEAQTAMLKHRFLHALGAFLTLLSTTFALLHFNDRMFLK